MAYQRLILHYGPDGTSFLGSVSQEAVSRCWFELLRQGGCGAGELALSREFLGRQAIQPGDWIACEYTAGERWYWGRVEEIQSESPSGLKVRLEGPGIELNEVYPGALVPTVLGYRPHRYARTQKFSEDPDRGVESADVVENSQQLIRKLLEQYVVPQTKIQYVPARIEAGPLARDVTSVKFHGEETVRSILKDLAVRARNAAWGVDAQGEFFFLQARSDVLAVYQENQDLTRLTETRSREWLYNRVVLTGDYVYDRQDYISQIARRSYRWRGNYRQPDSVLRHGERRIRLWIPWIRTAEDSRAFVSEFFRIYAQPAAKFQLETIGQSVLPLPWLGCVQVRDRQGMVLATLQPERIRVQFDHVPRFRIELGPSDPQELWPEPPHDERWELPQNFPSGFGEEEFPSGPDEPSGGSWGGSEDEQTNSQQPHTNSDAETLSEQSDFLSEDSWDSVTSEQSLDSFTDSLSSDWGESGRSTEVESESDSEFSSLESVSFVNSVESSTGSEEHESSPGLSSEWESLSLPGSESGFFSEVSSGISEEFSWETFD